MRRILATRSWLIAEFLLLFGGAPALILALRDRDVMIAALWGGAALTWLWLRRQGPAAANIWNRGGLRAGLRPVLVRFAILAPLIALATWFLTPDLFLSLPRDQPVLWLAVLILYPLLSVWPQEMIYRAFLYERYQPLFGRCGGYVLASGLAFGLMHLIFLNAVAVVMTLAGGLLFASDYSRHRSLALACLEHALYGCLIFTIGLGRYFYSGAAWR